MITKFDWAELETLCKSVGLVYVRPTTEEDAKKLASAATFLNHKVATVLELVALALRSSSQIIKNDPRRGKTITLPANPEHAKICFEMAANAMNGDQNG